MIGGAVGAWIGHYGPYEIFWARPRNSGRLLTIAVADPRSEQLALPRLQGSVARWPLAGAVVEQPRGGALLGVFLVDRFTRVVQLEHVGEDREAGLHLRR